jgi:hypothetical protein
MFSEIDCGVAQIICKPNLLFWTLTGWKTIIPNSDLEKKDIICKYLGRLYQERFLV